MFREANWLVYSTHMCMQSIPYVGYHSSLIRLRREANKHCFAIYASNEVRRGKVQDLALPRSSNNGFCEREIWVKNGQVFVLV